MTLLISRDSPRFLETASLKLKISTFSSKAVTIQCEGLLSNNTFSFNHSTSADSTKTSSEVSLGGEYPLSVTAYSDDSLDQNDCYAILELYTSGNVKIGVLAQGYINDFQNLVGYSTFESPLTNNGMTRVVTIANPSVGQDWSFAPDAGIQLLLTHCFFNIVISSGSGSTTREAEIHIYDTDGGITLWASSAGGGFSGVGTGNLLFSQSYGVRGLVENNGYSSPILGGIHVKNPMTIESAVSSLQGTDQLSNIRLLVQEWKSP